MMVLTHYTTMLLRKGPQVRCQHGGGVPQKHLGGAFAWGRGVVNTRATDYKKVFLDKGQSCFPGLINTSHE